MRDDLLDTLPEPQRDGVRAALRAVPPLEQAETIVRVSSGATDALLFRVDAEGHAYLVRMEGTPSPLRNPYQYIAMRAASEAGIAPRLHHVNEPRRIAVMDFIVEQPLETYPGGGAALAEALGQLLRRLQSVSGFPYFVDYPDIVARLFAHVRRTGLFERGLLDSHWAHLEALKAKHPWDRATLVPSHNDANARNVLFDGNRLWLIDWESAYLNDPLADAAIMLDNLAREPEAGCVLLRTLLGHEPDAAARERLALLRALTRLYYAGVLLSASARLPRAAPDADLSAPSLDEFTRAHREGRLTCRSPESIHIAGKMYLAAFLHGGTVPALETI